MGNHLYFLKPDSSWKQQKNTLISEIDSVHSTKRVVMVTSQHLLTRRHARAKHYEYFMLENCT